MKKWIVYLLGVITGVVLTFAFAFFRNISDNYGIIGLELFEEAEECTEYSQFEIMQVLDSECALAHTNNSYSEIVFIIPTDDQQFYDNQKFILNSDQCVLHVGTYKYSTRIGMEKTVKAIRIIDGVESTKNDEVVADKNTDGKTFFDKPGDCVSRKNFEVQEVLDSGDAIAKEIIDSYSGIVLTSDLEVLILAKDGSNFYNNQIIKAPKGKSARQIGNYKYNKYGDTKVIPIIAFK